MRLLHTSTFKLHEFSDGEVPPYAILSHRWKEEEVTYADIITGKAPELIGWAKLTGCCAKAASDGWLFVWIDTCCIDKSSSAELSEAINSMFAWYHQAEVCYVYLSDVHPGQDPREPRSDFQKSNWFTRGWTLQELLAPRFLEFFDRDWDIIGTKFSLQDLISQITRISVRHLGDFRSSSVAQKMSWASRRKTTRVEDEAYSLLGLFNANMPVLYGEKHNAFLRLQLEILNQTSDESLFAWMDISFDIRDSFDSTGPFAQGPGCFLDSGDIVPAMFQKDREPARMTSNGLLLRWPSLKLSVISRYDRIEDVYIVPLNCERLTSDENENMGEISPRGSSSHQRRNVVCLEVVQDSTNDNTYQRSCEFMEGSVDDFVPQSPFGILKMYIQQHRDHQDYVAAQLYDVDPILHVEFGSLQREGFQLTDNLQRSNFITMHRDGSFSVTEAPRSVLVREDQPGRFYFSHGVEDFLHVLMSFDSPQLGSFCLVVIVMHPVALIDLVLLPPGHRVTSIAESATEQKPFTAEGPILDRISLKISEEVYISATLKRRKSPSYLDAGLVVKLSVDRFKKWPSPEEIWAKRTRPPSGILQALEVNE